MTEALKSVSKADIMSIPFDDIIDEPTESTLISGRINPAQVGGIPSDDSTNKITLRRKLSNLFFDTTGGNFERLEMETYIKQDTARKWFNGKNRISRKGLAKFIVGLKIDIDTANELFCLQGHPINLQNRFEYIIACAIKNGDSIDDFYDDVLKYCNVDIVGVERPDLE